MSAIHQSSNKIADIIGVIDGIAFRPTSWPSMRRWKRRGRARPQALRS